MRRYKFTSSSCPITIGREESNGISLPADKVSEQHAEIRYEDSFVIYDKDSLNGTFVSSEAKGLGRISKKKLEDEDLIHIGLSGYVLRAKIEGNSLLLEEIKVPSALEASDFTDGIKKRTKRWYED
jgi:pSer/pThr/pTyr-binding forkhead associated (FHA) protein